MSGFPVLHCFPEFAQTPVCGVGDTIQPPYLLSPPSSPPLNLSQHQGLSNEAAFQIRWPKYWSFSISSIQFSRSVMSDSLWPHGLQHTRPPCPSSTPRVYSNSCPLSQWCHPTISSSINPFSSHLQYFPASGSFQMSQLISFKIDWFNLTAVQGTLKSVLQHHSSKASILQWSALFTVQLSHSYMTAGKTIALTIWTFVGKVMSLFFSTLSRFVSFPSKEQASFNFMAAITVCSDSGAQENKICYCFHFLPFCLPWSDEIRCHDLSFLRVEFQASFFTLLFHPHQEAL